MCVLSSWHVGTLKGTCFYSHLFRAVISATCLWLATIYRAQRDCREGMLSPLLSSLPTSPAVFLVFALPGWLPSMQEAFCYVWVFYLFICLGGHTSNVQGLLLTLHSGINPSSAWGIIWDARNGAWVSCVQGKCISNCTIALEMIVSQELQYERLNGCFLGLML